jgi:hypothetical protein
MTRLAGESPEDTQRKEMMGTLMRQNAKVNRISSQVHEVAVFLRHRITLADGCLQLMRFRSS